jgi:beta-N-acetylhexosaminidase
VGDVATWEAKTLPPFAEAVRNGVPSIMTGHVAMPFLDPTLSPATFSFPILTGILRQRLGFDGLIVTDSLGMDGAGGDTGLPDRCLRAFEAGCDVLLSPYDPGIVPCFVRALESGRITEARLEASVHRVRQAKARLAQLPRAAVRADDDAAALALGRRAVRVLRNKACLPLAPGTFAVLTQWRNEESQYFPREPGVLASLQHGLQLADPGAPLLAVSRACQESEQAGILARVHAVPTVVLTAIVKNYAGDPYKGLLSDGTAALIRKMKAAGKRVVLVLLGSPYPAAQAPEADAVLCTGGDTLGSVEGVLAFLSGK